LGRCVDGVQEILAMRWAWLWFLVVTFVAGRASAAESVVLVGVHGEAIEGYAPMFGPQGKPRTDVKAGYSTLVLHVKDGMVTLIRSATIGSGVTSPRIVRG
jgi:hypothetical protein